MNFEKFSKEKSLYVATGAALGAGALSLFLAEKNRRLIKTNNNLLESLAAADIDTVTGLPNRRKFDEHLHRVHERFLANSEESYTLFLWDADNFKIVNDHHGHAAGDAILRKMGGVITNKLRPSDFAARIGGDEFAAVIEGELSEEFIETLIGRVRFGMMQSLDASFQNGDIGISARNRVSISGGAAVSRIGKAPETVLREADEAMYCNKEQRR